MPFSKHSRHFSIAHWGYTSGVASMFEHPSRRFSEYPPFVHARLRLRKCVVVPGRRPSRFFHALVPHSFASFSPKGFGRGFRKSADSSACWNQSQPTQSSRKSWPSRLSIHVRKSNPTETKGSLLFWGHPCEIFFPGRGGGCAAVQPAHRSILDPSSIHP